MLKLRLLTAAAMIAAGSIGVVAVVAGQPARAAAGAGDDLLAEVRALRAEFNQAAGTSVRTQLLVARLQLQEQRVIGAARQLADVQERLASVAQAQAALVERLAASEDGLRRLPPEDQSDDQIRALKLQLEQSTKREQDLRAQEAAASSRLAAEQGKWTEFNARLDALERALPGPSPR
jgi:hypothetical protein